MLWASTNCDHARRFCRSTLMLQWVCRKNYYLRSSGRMKPKSTAIAHRSRTSTQWLLGIFTTCAKLKKFSVPIFSLDRCIYLHSPVAFFVVDMLLLAKEWLVEAAARSTSSSPLPIHCHAILCHLGLLGIVPGFVIFGPRTRLHAMIDANNTSFVWSLYMRMVLQ